MQILKLTKNMILLQILIFTAVAKLIRALVLSADKMELSQLFLYFAVYVSVGNIINCNNPVIFLRSDLIIISPEETETRTNDAHQIWI